MRKIRTTLLAGVMVLGLSGIANAEPEIAILYPAAGDAFSRADVSEIEVIGTAAFDEAVASSRTFYARRDACANGDDPKYLSVQQGSGETEGCQYVAPGVLVDLLGGAEEYFPAVNGVPLVIDASKNMHVHIQLDGDTSVGLGLADFQYAVTAQKSTGQQVTLGSGSKQYTVTPMSSDYEHTFDVNLADSLHGVQITDIQLMVNAVGAQAQHGGLDYNGATFLEVPMLDAGSVQVSTSPSFGASSTVTANLNEDGEWQAFVPTPAAGARKIYARAVQGAVTASANVPITITA